MFAAGPPPAASPPPFRPRTLTPLPAPPHPRGHTGQPGLEGGGGGADVALEAPERLRPRLRRLVVLLRALQRPRQEEGGGSLSHTTDPSNNNG